ncbi:MAG: DUF3795 domain-containing protein [Mogibacterium sp.]|nr:DUF3795 domain-containing protein [Mogibacterium sp.]
MNNFKRNNPLFSMCGLNCGLCTIRLGGHCPGCGQGNKPCKIARCGIEHGVEYCFQCPEYPCELYDHVDEYDSFMTHLHQKADLMKAKEIGIEAYTEEQSEKVDLLDTLLNECNSGREKTLFSLAVNLLSVDEIKKVLDEGGQLASDMPIKDKAKFISGRFREIAADKEIELKLRKKRK